MLENTRADDALRNHKALFSAMERQTDSSIAGTLRRVQALVSETVSMVRAQREDVKDGRSGSLKYHRISLKRGCLIPREKAGKGEERIFHPDQQTQI